MPDKIYTNKYLETIVDTNDNWIEKTLGIKERRIAEDNQTTSDLAYKAGARAIENAHLTKDDMDLIIVATSTNQQRQGGIGYIQSFQNQQNGYFEPRNYFLKDKERSRYQLTYF